MRLLCRMLFLSFFAAALPVRAEAVPTRYPFSLDVRMAQSAADASYHHPEMNAVASPLNPESLTFTGRQARAAYESLAKRLFTAGEPALVLEVDQVEASVALESDGFKAVVVHQLRLFGPKSQLLGEWKVDELDGIEGLGEQAIPDALGRAAGFAAQLFESELESSGAFCAFLTANGFEPGRVHLRAPQHARRPPPEPHVVRGKLVAYLDLGLDFMFYDASLSTPSPGASRQRNGQDAGPFGTVRGGIANSWAFVQGAVSSWSSPLEASTSTADVLSVGLDAGPLIRIHDYVELGAGLGLHWMKATATDHSFSQQDVFVTERQLMPSVLLQMRWTPSLFSRPWRVSLEYRRNLSALDFTFAGTPGGPQTIRELNAGNSFAALIGGEISIFGVAR